MNGFQLVFYSPWCPLSEENVTVRVFVTSLCAILRNSSAQFEHEFSNAENKQNENASFGGKKET